MSTTVRSQSPARPALEPLAANGGPKSVRAPYREKWRRRWWSDAIQIAKHLKWGLTTSPMGDGAVAAFEQDFARLTGCKHALAMNTGTATLHSALFAVGVGPGDEVILPSYTFHATASSVLCCGGKPVFCDIDARSLTADPADVERRITPKTKAILVVHVWGNPAELDALKAVADRHRLPLVEDCSHAHGATYKGKSVGAWGDIGCFSLQGTKAVSGGEAGVAVCDKPEYRARMLALGHPFRAGHELKDADFGLGAVHVGPKYRPHLYAMLLAQSDLRRLPDLNAKRRRNWAILGEELADCPGVRPVETLPGAERGGFLEFKFVLDPDRVRGSRDEFLAEVVAEGVPASADRYGSLHHVPIFRRGGPITLDLLESKSAPPVVDLPTTQSLDGRVFTLPAFTEVPEPFVRQCAAGLRKVAAHRAI